MKIKGIILFASTFFLTLTLQAQNSIKGVITDTTLNANLFDATVSVLHSQDSILEKFTYTDSNGSFTITELPIGKYILLVTKKEYASYVEPFNIDDLNSHHDFKSILLQKKAKLLEEVIINGIATAITFKGDTAEYNAGSFVIQPNDKVEDLLKRLPGIQVDKDGRITAQGQTVNKVLVDGEEFFSDDPTLVTRNIRADMVKSLQI